MRETRSSGSVRGASGDGRPYRERILAVGAGIDEGPQPARKLSCAEIRNFAQNPGR